MELLVIGAGPVGRALARAWSAGGHTVTLAVRDPDNPKHDGYRTEHALTDVAVLPTADATLLSVPGEQLPTLLDADGPQLDGRLIIDATNTPGGAHLHRLRLLAQRLPNAQVYRAFTSTGWENVTRDVAGERPDMLYAGPDGRQRSTVERLICDAGPRPVWLPEGAEDVVDGVLRLWFALARTHGRHLAFRVLSENPQL